MILLILIALFAEVYAMDNPSPIVRRGDFISFRLLNITESGKEENVPAVASAPEVFDTFFCTDSQAVSLDDTNKYAHVRTSLFMQLFVQASKATGPREQVFQELLEKIKKKDYLKINSGQIAIYNNLVSMTAEGKEQTHNKVNVCEEEIGITLKDLSYRLLSCIPTHQTKSLVNGKQVCLKLFQFETDNDKIINQKMIQDMDQLPPQKWEWGKELMPRVPQKQYSGHVLQTDYFFETDAQHQETIVKEYYRLTSQFIPEPSYATSNGIPMPENP